MAGGDALSCFACGEQNSADSRYCKHCGRALVVERNHPSVTQDPRNRLMLTLVIVLLLACVLFGLFGLITSKVFGPSRSRPELPAALVITNVS